MKHTLRNVCFIIKIVESVAIMPPTHKFTKDEIITAALNLVRRDGVEALTARGLGAELGISSHPIFTAFQNMEEVQKEILEAAKNVYGDYSNKGLAEELPFQGVGIYYFRFAKDEPKLFELLFMKGSGTAASVADTLHLAHDNYETIISVIQKGYGLSRDNSHRIFETMWLYVHGISSLHVTGMIRFTDDEVYERMDDVFFGVLQKLKEETQGI